MQNLTTVNRDSGGYEESHVMSLVLAFPGLLLGTPSSSFLIYDQFLRSL